MERAKTVAARTNKVNLRRKERWENGVTLCLSLPGVPDHAPGKKQEPGTDFDVGTPGCRQIDIEASLVVLEAESDDAALLKEVVGLTDGEDRGIVDRLEQSCRALFVLTNDKKKIAGPGIVVFEKMTHLQRMRADAFSSHRAFQKSE